MSDPAEDRGDEMTPEQLAALDNEESKEEPKNEGGQDQNDAEDATDPTKPDPKEEEPEVKKGESADDGDDGDSDGDVKNVSDMIPRERYNKRNQQYKESQLHLSELQRKNEALEKQLAARSTEDKNAASALLDEKLDKAARAHAKALEGDDPEKITDTLKDLTKVQAELIAASQSPAEQAEAPTKPYTREDFLVDQALDEVEALYPQLDTESEIFDQDLVDEVEEYRDGFIAAGLARDDAVRKAVRVTMLEAGIQPSGSKDVVTNQELQKRRAANAAAAAKKAPKVDVAGNPGKGDAKVNIDDLTDEEIDNLPESTVKQLRGDDIT